jgi:hypothetical protein
MSYEQFSSLYACVVASAAAVLCWWASNLPEESHAWKRLSSVLNKWALSTRWSLEPRRRLRMIAVVSAIIAIAMLYAFVTNPPPRYTG